MNNSYERTKISAGAMQGKRQDRIIRATSAREGSDRCEQIRNNREMLKGAMAVKKSSPETPRKTTTFVETSMDQHVYLVRNDQDTRRQNAPRNASQNAARVQAEKKVQSRRGPTPAPQAQPACAAQGIRQRPRAQREYSPSEKQPQGAVVVEANTPGAQRAREIRARRNGAVPERDQPRVVRAHGISNTPSKDSRRARLLEQKLRAMSSNKK